MRGQLWKHFLFATRVALALVPLSTTAYAAAYIGITQPAQLTLQEENRRIIERQDERIIALHSEMLEIRKAQQDMAANIWRLMLAVGGSAVVSGAVGVDRAVYRVKRKGDAVT